ncbi:MAG: ATP-binding protein, partial [Leptolyngbyaceae bacterium]|nr:ATP-binding protein [Leptolyngbyaceae bacterium]
GIEPEDQAVLFDRFFRVENRVHTLEGTGLGLSIVRNIVSKHHSTVHLVSEVGTGTTFWFDLAIFREDAPSFEALMNASTRLHSDDTDDTANFLAKL